MKVDFFIHKKSVVPKGRSRDAIYYLERIRDGAVQKQVEAIRLATTPEKKDELKGQLSAVTFCGTFSTRNKDGLKDSSGLAIIDLDKLENVNQVIELKAKLTENKHIYACWISPSGLGLKALIPIPIVSDNKVYNSYYHAIVESLLWINDEYNKKVIDTSGQDISRLCFESYDPDIYINFDAEIWTKCKIDESKKFEESIGVITNIPLVDQDEIANRLLVWFKGIYNGLERNNSFHKLALAFNDFGISKSICERYILPNAQKDFPESEIQALINSAYKHTANFGSKQFEDVKKVKAVKSLTLTGKTEKEIIEKFPEISPENLKREISIIRNEINVEEFWYYDHEGKMKISPHKFKFYLEHKNFHKHYPVAKSKTFTFVVKENNFVDEVSEFQIKDFVLEQLMATANLDAYDLMAASSRAFTPNYLSMLSTAQFQIESDTKDCAWIYYRNLALKITKDARIEVPYSELEGMVWKKQVIDRAWVKSDHHKSEYRTFIWLCASQDVAKYNSLKSVIGYLMHSYKTSANNKAIIFNDETISENPNGGSGKSLFWNALSHIKKVASIDGKTFEFSKSFPYQSVPTDTQLLVFDDVKKNFNFEALFSLITEGITLEYKGQDAIKLPVQQSPKLVITTNYTIKGTGGSFERRKFELEMSSYFSANHSPIDEFGHMLFDDWDDEEWARFDHFMVNCLEYYLNNGLVEFNHKSLDLRKLMNETSLDFLQWIDEVNTIKFGERYIKPSFFERFINENTDFKWLKQNTFNKWIQKWTAFRGYQYHEGNTQGQRWFSVTKINEEPTKDDFDNAPVEDVF